MDFELVETFNFKGRLCAIVKVTYDSVVFHNGYVSALEKNRGIFYEDIVRDIDTEELTYSGYLTRYGISEKYYFVGFDTNHLYNLENPDTQTYSWVRFSTMKLATELILKGI